MSTFVIGDVQGCFQTLEALLEKLPFESSRDQIWLLGDLVNRGPQSLEVLRWAKSTKNVNAILGNHDLWLLACAQGASPRSGDTIDPILRAKDRADLVEWLRHRDLVHQLPKHLLLHAGLLPQWSVKEALALGAQATEALRGKSYSKLVERLKKREKLQWKEAKSDEDRLIAILSVLTRLRVCQTNGEMDFGFTGPLSEVERPYYAWFQIPERRSVGTHVVFGHWASLGFHQEKNVSGLDSGCVWGRELTALCLETGKVYQQATLETGLDHD